MDDITGSSLLASARTASITRGSIGGLAQSASAGALMDALLQVVALRELHAATVLALAVAASGSRVPAAAAQWLAVDADEMGNALMIATRVEGDLVSFTLDLVESGRLSREREATLLYVASESLEGPAPDRLITTLRLFARQRLGIDSGLMIGLAALKLDHPQLNELTLEWRVLARKFIDSRGYVVMRKQFLGPVLEALPELAPARMVGGHTVVRAEPKVGRNEPCSCGSGRKYKKCCADRDEATFGQQSRVEEFQTAAQHRKVQEQIFEAMRPHELAQLDPSTLSNRQVIDAIRTFTSRKRWEDAERFCDELDKRDDLTISADLFRGELIDAALAENAIDIAERQIARAHLDADNAARIALQIALARKAPDALGQLETALASALRHDDVNAIIEVAFTLLKTSPALGIVVARGSIQVERMLDSQVLLEEIGEARDVLGLPAYEPWWEIYDLMLDQGIDRESEELDSADREREIERLRAELTDANGRASRLQRDLASRERDLADVSLPTTEPKAGGVDERKLEELEAERRRLRMKIGAMKAEIAEGTAQRAELRRTLAKAADEKTTASREPAVVTVDDAEDAAVGDAVSTRPRRMLVPHFTSHATRSIESLPRRVVVEAIRDAARLAVGDDAAWNGAKQMKRAPEVLTCRLGRSYRMLFRLAEAQLEVLDVIHRRDLETALVKIQRS